MWGDCILRPFSLSPNRHMCQWHSWDIAFTRMGQTDEPETYYLLPPQLPRHRDKNQGRNAITFQMERGENHSKLKIIWKFIMHLVRVKNQFQMLILLIPSLWIQITINRKADKSCPQDKAVLSKQLEVKGSAVKIHTIFLKAHCIRQTPS